MKSYVAVLKTKPSTVLEDIARAMKLAQEANADFMAIECVLDESITKHRLEQRLKEGSVSDGRWEIYESQKQDFHKIMELPQQNHIIVDTSQPVNDIIKAVWERIY